MSSNDLWDFYFCEIDGKPHSNMVKLSLFDVAPIVPLSFFHCIEISLRHPNPENGMTTNEEFQTLKDLEDLIEQNETRNLEYVARQTGDCKRKFFSTVL